MRRCSAIVSCRTTACDWKEVHRRRWPAHEFGEPNFAIIQRYVDDIVTVSEEAIISAMRAIWETMKIVIEPLAAVPYAAIKKAKSMSVAKRIGIILTGGNVDLDALPWNSSRDR